MKMMNCATFVLLAMVVMGCGARQKPYEKLTPKERCELRYSEHNDQDMDSMVGSHGPVIENLTICVRGEVMELFQTNPVRIEPYQVLVFPSGHHFDSYDGGKIYYDPAAHRIIKVVRGKYGSATYDFTEKGWVDHEKEGEETTPEEIAKLQLVDMWP